jgi:hypothetical protein
VLATLGEYTVVAIFLLPFVDCSPTKAFKLMVELVGSHSRAPRKQRSAGKAAPRTPTKGRLEQRLADAPYHGARSKHCL